MYKILFVSALSWELKHIKKQIKQLKIPNLKIDFFQTWMWNYNMILNLTSYLQEKKSNWTNYDFILNIWSCGYNTVISSQLQTLFYQIPRIINLSNNKELLIPINFKIAPFATCLSSETPIKHNKLNININCQKFLNPQSIINVIDMESYGFELVANKFLIPRLILKIPVDIIWEKFDINKFIQKVENINFEKILLEIKAYLQTIPAKHNLSKYINHFNFTVAQQHIFERLYYKYEALYWNFQKFFEQNKNLDRKNFLKKLNDI